MGNEALKSESQEWNQGEINLEGQSVVKAMGPTSEIRKDLRGRAGEQSVERRQNPKGAT